MTFDLEKARDAAKFDDRMAITMFPLAIAEIERLRASLIDLHAEYINTLEKNPDCSAWDLDEQSDADQRRLRRNAAHAISIVEPPIYLKAEQQATKIRELKADLEQSERVIEARLDVIDQQAARIQELGGMLSIRTEELEIAHSCARSEREMHEKELVVFARKIAELEDALVEGLTNFLHYRASCYDPARRCPYAKECDDCSTWDACGHVEKFRSEARQRLQAEGKIGPDDSKKISHLRPYEVVAADLAGMLAKSWQITDERKAAIQWAEEMAGDCKAGDVLRDMLVEVTR